MTHSKSSFLAAVLFLALLSSGFLIAQESATQEAATEETATEETSVVSADDESQMSEKELNLLYRRANLRIAELELERALEMNEQRPVVPRLTVERLKSNLLLAKEQYRLAQSDTAEASQYGRLRHAMERVRLAKVDLEAAEELKERKAISDWEYRRIGLKHELAELNLALLRHPRGYMTVLDHLQSQVDQLADEYLALEQRLAKLEGSLLSR
ncbi:MAG: hypothetical protein NXI32_09140 [bacterium]|nr:hypothetical protein [bacterium]